MGILDWLFRRKRVHNTASPPVGGKREVGVVTINAPLRQAWLAEYGCSTVKELKAKYGDEEATKMIMGFCAACLARGRVSDDDYFYDEELGRFP